MICEKIKFSNGAVAVICRGRRVAMHKCHYCRAPAVCLCDHKLPNGKDCDLPCCAEHAMKQGGAIDYCLLHWRDRWD